MFKVPTAVKVVAEIELHASIWGLVGVKPEDIISVDEAERNALESNLPPMVKADLHMTVTKLRHAIKGVLIGQEVAKDEHTLLLVSDWWSIKPSLSIPQELWASDALRIIDTEPSGLVKVTQKTKIEILLKMVSQRKKT